MLRTALVSAVALLTYTPAVADDDFIAFREAVLRIGMSREAVVHKLRQSGFTVGPEFGFPDSKSGIPSTNMIIADSSVRGLERDDTGKATRDPTVGTVRFAGDKLTGVHKNWSSTFEREPARLVGGLHGLASKFVSESRTDCRLSVGDDHPEPWVNQRTVWLNCGRKSIVVVWTRFDRPVDGVPEYETVDVREDLR